MTFADQFLATLYGTKLGDESTRLGQQMDESLQHFAEECTRRLLSVSGVSEMHTQAHAAKCECGSGSDEPSGAHSHWCRLWISP